MSDDAALWLGIIGTVTGTIGMGTGIAAAMYARRQALAAEGPRRPDVECDHHGWDAENPNWYTFSIIVRNRTDRSWRWISAAIRGIRGSRLIAQNQIPNLGEDHSPVFMKLSDIDRSKITATASPQAAVAPVGTQSSQHYIGSHPVSYDTLYAYFPPDVRASSVSIDLIFEDKAEIARPMKITLKRRLAPRTIIPAE